jgi:hypothetical protein
LHMYSYTPGPWPRYNDYDDVRVERSKGKCYVFMFSLCSQCLVLFLLFSSYFRCAGSCKRAIIRRQLGTQYSHGSSFQRYISDVRKAYCYFFLWFYRPCSRQRRHVSNVFICWFMAISYPL